MKEFRFSAKVFRWPGEIGWYFVYLPKDTSENVNKVAKKYGAGFVKVKVNIGKTSWQTALFPNKIDKTFMISVKKSVREKEGIYEGDIVKVKFEVI
jgi:hypothetical protein